VATIKGVLTAYPGGSKVGVLTPESSGERQWDHRHAGVILPRNEVPGRRRGLPGGGNRFSSAMKDSDEHFHQFRDISLDMRFMPAGRVSPAMGSIRATTPYNCYVSGTIEDSFVHGEGNIMQRATEAAATMRMGGGIGYDFSTLRPKGTLIRKLPVRLPRVPSPSWRFMTPSAVASPPLGIAGVLKWASSGSITRTLKSSFTPSRTRTSSRVQHLHRRH
jgi:hypothetical protein